MTKPALTAVHAAQNSNINEIFSHSLHRVEHDEWERAWSGKVAITLINLISFSITSAKNTKQTERPKRKAEKKATCQGGGLGVCKTRKQSNTIALKHNCYFAPVSLLIRHSYSTSRYLLFWRGGGAAKRQIKFLL